MSFSLSMPSLLLLRTPFLAPPQSLTRQRPIPGPKTTTSTVVSLSRKNNKGNDPSAADAPDRLISAVSYFYPFFDGIQYGRHLITQYPTFGSLVYPFLPSIRAFRSFPLNSFLVFVTLYFVVVRNQNFSRYVRFNTMQAIVLDVLLIFPELLERSFNVREGLGLDVLMSLDSTVFLYLLVCLVYGSGCCLVGKVPRLPIVAEAAERPKDERGAIRMHPILSVSLEAATAQSQPFAGLLEEKTLIVTRSNDADYQTV